MTVTLPLPPSVNNLYTISTRHGYVQRFVSKRGKAWFEEAGWLLKSAYSGKPITSEVKIAVDIYFARRIDYDNALKVVGDLLQKGGVVANDDQIMSAEINKHKVAHVVDERLELELTIL